MNPAPPVTTTFTQLILERLSWDAVQSAATLTARLVLASSTISLLTFLMVQGSLRPGWDWLVSRKLSSLWREIDGSGLESGIVRFCDTAVEVGFSEI